MDDADDERRGNDDQKRCTSSASPACSPQDDGDVSPDQYRLKTAFSCFFRGICAADSALAAHPAILSSWWRLPAIKVPQRPTIATPAARLAPLSPSSRSPRVPNLTHLIGTCFSFLCVLLALDSTPTPLSTILNFWWHHIKIKGLDCEHFPLLTSLIFCHLLTPGKVMWLSCLTVLILNCCASLLHTNCALSTF